MAVGVWAPLAYLVFLCGTLWALHKVMKKKQSQENDVRAQEVVTWFPKRKARNMYYSLISMEPAPPPPAIAGALLNRAMEALENIKTTKESKGALMLLLQKNQIGDSTWEDFLAAERQVESEVQEIVEEANTFVPGFGQTLFAVAADMNEHERLKNIYKNISKSRETVKEKAEDNQLYGSNSFMSIDTVTLMNNREILQEQDSNPLNKLDGDVSKSTAQDSATTPEVPVQKENSLPKEDSKNVEPSKVNEPINKDTPSKEEELKSNVPQENLSKSEKAQEPIKDDSLATETKPSARTVVEDVKPDDSVADTEKSSSEPAEKPLTSTGTPQKAKPESTPTTPATPANNETNSSSNAETPSKVSELASPGKSVAEDDEDDEDDDNEGDNNENGNEENSPSAGNGQKSTGSGASKSKKKNNKKKKKKAGKK